MNSRTTSEVRAPITWRLPDRGDQQWGELRTVPRFCATKRGSRWFPRLRWGTTGHTLWQQSSLWPRASPVWIGTHSTFGAHKISGWGIYRAAGKTGLQLKTQSLYAWDMTPLEYLTLERRVWRRQSPRQRRSQPLRTVGRDCRRQGREQDRVGEPDKREFQEDDNKVRLLRSSAEGGWPQWFQ